MQNAAPQRASSEKDIEVHVMLREKIGETTSGY